MGYSIVLKKNETATMFFLKKSSLVLMSVCASGCVCLSVCVCVCVHDNSKNNGSIHLKLEHTEVYKK